MITAIRRWLMEREQRAKEHAFERGYAYTAAALLKMRPHEKAEALQQLEFESEGWPEDRPTGHAFNSGMRTALTHWGRKCHC